MARRGKDLEPVRVPGEAPQAGLLHRPFDEAQVDAEGQQVGPHLFRVVQGEAHPALGMAPLQFRHQGRQQVVADGQAGSQMQVEGGGPGGTGLDLPHLVQHLLGPGQQLPARLVEQQLASHPVEELHRELPLQVRQGHAGGGLGQGHRLGGPGDVAVAGHGGEDFQLAQGDFHRRD